MMAEVECKCGGRTKLINSIIKSGPHPVYSNQTITNRLNEESHIEYHLEGVSYYLTPDGTKFEIKQRKTREFLEI